MSPTSSHRSGRSRTGRTGRAGRTGLLRQLVGAVRTAVRPGAPGLVERGRAVPRLVRAVLGGRYRAVTPGHLGLLALALAYVVSPVDLVPEGLLPLVGLADDAVVVAWLAATLVHDTDEFLRWERGDVGPRDRDGSPGRAVREPPPGRRRHRRSVGGPDRPGPRRALNAGAGHAT